MFTQRGETKTQKRERQRVTESLIKNHPKTFEMFRETIGDRFRVHCEHVKARCEATKEVGFREIEADGELDFEEIEIPKIPTKFIEPIEGRPEIIFKTAAKHVMYMVQKCMEQYRSVYKGDTDRILRAMIRSFYLDVVDTDEFIDMLYKISADLPIYTLCEDRSVYGYLEYRWNVCARCTQTNCGSRRESELLGIFQSVMVEEDFGSSDLKQ